MKQSGSNVRCRKLDLYQLALMLHHEAMSLQHTEVERYSGRRRRLSMRFKISRFGESRSVISKEGTVTRYAGSQLTTSELLQ